MPRSDKGKTGSRGARGVRLNPEHDDRTRAKIQTSQIVNRLEKFILSDSSKVDMPPHKVTAALGLLRKTLPDLNAAEITHTTKRGPHDYSRDELVAILADATHGGGRTLEATRRLDGPDPVYGVHVPEVSDG
jgi:hypothetical protein